jgi:hypothetical protein
MKLDFGGTCCMNLWQSSSMVPQILIAMLRCRWCRKEMADHTSARAWKLLMILLMCASEMAPGLLFFCIHIGVWMLVKFQRWGYGLSVYGYLLVYVFDNSPNFRNSMTQYGRACYQSVPLIYTMLVLLLLFLFHAFKGLLIKLVVVFFLDRLYHSFDRRNKGR